MVDPPCFGYDPNRWFPSDSYERTRGARLMPVHVEAAQICKTQCYYRVECIATNFLTIYGIYGGRTSHERRRLREYAVDFGIVRKLHEEEMPRGSQGIRLPLAEDTTYEIMCDKATLIDWIYENEEEGCQIQEPTVQTICQVA